MTNVQDTQLQDQFGRTVDYLRLSVTDRCDFRCVYCMAEEMEFLPRREILSLEEIQRICAAFVRLGVKKIRVTGGEPLIRKGVVELLQDLGQLPGLRELAVTTNGSQLETLAASLQQAGVKRINVSLDSLDPVKFKQLTRTGELSKVLRGIQAAREQGFQGLKLNAVVLKGRNDDQILPLVEYARQHQLDLAFIEEMPLGQITDHSLQESFMPSAAIRELIETRYPLLPMTAAQDSGGPARYYQYQDTPGRVGFISPHSHNFCASCNRVRLTAEGRLLLCLGNEHSVDLKAVVRSTQDDRVLEQAIRDAMNIKPERHHFEVNDEPQIVRFMNMTGG